MYVIGQCTNYKWLCVFAREVSATTLSLSVHADRRLYTPRPPPPSITAISLTPIPPLTLKPAITTNRLDIIIALESRDKYTDKASVLYRNPRGS